MCMDDIRIGRATRSTIRTLTLAAGQNVLVPYNQKRTAIQFGTTSTGTVDIFPGTTATAGAAFRSTTTSQPIQFRLVLDGDFVRNQWVGVPSAAGVVITVIESELADE